MLKFFSVCQLRLLLWNIFKRIQAIVVHPQLVFWTLLLTCIRLSICTILQVWHLDHLAILWLWTRLLYQRVTTWFETLLATDGRKYCCQAFVINKIVDSLFLILCFELLYSTIYELGAWLTLRLSFMITLLYNLSNRLLQVFYLHHLLDYILVVQFYFKGL